MIFSGARQLPPLRWICTSAVNEINHFLLEGFGLLTETIKSIDDHKLGGWMNYAIITIDEDENV